ncbi:MAG: hypothetical protein COB09_18960 [Thalassobium sp.]|nr:MAG: hypothetical protein COB09_18960 [Thalassobium sp.]
MHMHLEIIMPPTDDVESSIKQILAPFDENGKDDCCDPDPHAFWDFYVIGGRYAGEKKSQSFDKESLTAFYKDLNKNKITVSSLQCGKQKLEPSSQIPTVDKLWVKHFPDGGKVCPIFDHYNDQYEHSEGYPDIMTLKDTPENLEVHHVIIATPDWEDKIAAHYMVENSVYNGVNYLDTKWDGTIKGALEMSAEKNKRYTEEAKEKYTPKDDWLVVTVDYHS